MKRLFFCFCIGVGLCLVWCFGTTLGWAQEHPGEEVEHPGTAAEQPGPAITADQVKQSIKQYVDQETAANEGVFVMQDVKLNKVWRLQLAKIHDPVRRFEKDGQTIYFACNDFKAMDSSDVLDIDFWMVEENGKLKVIDTKIHKLNGEPRYTYEGTEIKEVK